MGPERIEVINSQRIEEYYWAGQMVTYVDNRKSELSFDDACIAAKKQGEQATHHTTGASLNG